VKEDMFRKEYRPLSDIEKASLDDLKEAAEYFAKTVAYNVPEGRERALAITKLEECVMWATKGVTK
jgi:hypothetical protein